MARRNEKTVRREKTSSGPSPWRVLGITVLITLGLAGAVYASQRVERFLIRDPRFVLPVAAEYGEQSPNLTFKGLRYASRSQAVRVFQPDLGRSVYLCPLGDRRNALLRVPWIEDATVMRTWPDRISVTLTERVPVAFVELKSDGVSRWSLIDRDGVILEPPAKGSFLLPVMSGTQRSEPLSRRGVRVRRMLRMMNDLGDLKDRVSEVDVSDLDDLKITMKIHDQAIVLMLGDANFRKHLQTFLANYEGIRQHMPAARVFDLRLDDRIVGVGQNGE